MKLLFKICSFVILLLIIWGSITRLPQIVEKVQASENKTSLITSKNIDYFTELAFGAEYQTKEEKERIVKWDSYLNIKIIGANKEDMREIQKIINILNSIEGIPLIKIVKENENIDLYICPESDFKKYIPNYVSTNGAFTSGFTTVDYSTVSYIITHATICIASDNSISQFIRFNSIKHELTHALGLLNDSYKYKDSIFNDSLFPIFNSSLDYSSLDKNVIKILYLNIIEPSMDKEQVITVLKKY